MILRLAVLALSVLSVCCARGQVTYGGGMALPADHTFIVHLTTAQLDTTSPDYNPAADDTTFYLVTTSDYYTYTFDGTSYGAPSPSTSLAGLGLGTGTKGVLYGRKFNDPVGLSFLLTGARNSVISYHTSPHAAFTQFVPLSPQSAVAVAQGQGLSLVASPTRVFVAKTTINASSPYAALSLTTGGATPTPVTFNQITETSFAPGADGLLYVVDWGNQLIDAFSLNISAEEVVTGELRLSFALPAGLENNTTGLGFAINDLGHLFMADGLGGGVEMDLLGNVLGTFSLPVGVTASNPGGKPSITYDSTGHVFVADPVYGLNWYQDASAVPEPSAWAMLLGGLGLLGFAIRCKRA